MNMSKKEIVRAIYQDFQAGDVPAILARFHPRISWEHDTMDHGIPWIVPGQGLSVVERFFAVVGREFAFSHFEVLSLFEGGRQVVALLRIEATIRSTGKPIEDREAHLFTFDDEGRVIGFRHILDSHQHLAASGAS